MATKSERFRAVVFDFDGTLIDTREIKTASYLRACEEVLGTGPGEREAVRESCRRTMGANRFLQLDDTLAALGREASPGEREAWSRRYSELNAQAMAGVAEFPAVRGLLADLDRRGYAVHAASGILEAEFRRELEKRDLAGYFREVRGGDKLGFLRELRERGEGPVLFVGDTDYDRRTAEAAGVEFFRVDADADLRRLGRLLAQASGPEISDRTKS